MRFLYTFFTSGYQKSGYHRLVSAQKPLFLISSSLQASRDRKILGCDQASFLIFLDFRRLGLSQKELVDFVVDKAHLALNDGAMFGVGGEGFMRLNVGCPRKTMERAMTQLKAAFDKKYKL